LGDLSGVTALPLLIAVGDPAGIGPEVSVKALASLDLGNVILVGCKSSIQAEASRVLGRLLPVIDSIRSVPEWSVYEPPLGGDGAVEVASIRVAAEACLAGNGRALVTGPIHKGRLAAKGFKFKGHTDFLGAIAGTEPVMAFAGGHLRVALVTAHVPLCQVPELATEERVTRVITCANQALLSLGIERPKLALCGVNPHAGEGGVIGDDEISNLNPAVMAARSMGLNVELPVAAENAFRSLNSRDCDMVVAMYHDQALPVLKLLAFGSLVNWTIGLPFVRTSVDHGTADDIVGKDIAEPSSMTAAIELALNLTA
jgi:4-hydroxythreonine-4-phosphate dehydrogenase